VGQGEDRIVDMDTPFGRKLPPGWTAELFDELKDTWLIWGGNMQNIAACQIDKTFLLESHLEYLWGRYEKDSGNS